MEASARPILVVGAGHMGGALIAGWRRAGALAPGDLAILDPHPGELAQAAEAWGARRLGALLEPSPANTVVLAVKPQAWREAAGAIEPFLATGAVLISIVAGAPAAALAAAFPRQRLARAMPTTAAALNAGATSLWSADAGARARARRLFEPLGVVVDLDDERLLHVATAASGSAPAYVYALAEALEAAGASRGLDAAAARALSRSAVIGAAALLSHTALSAADLRRQVASPGGTTQSALEVLMARDGLAGLVDRAVGAAVARSHALAEA